MAVGAVVVFQADINKQGQPVARDPTAQLCKAGAGPARSPALQPDEAGADSPRVPMSQYQKNWQDWKRKADQGLIVAGRVPVAAGNGPP